VMLNVPKRANDAMHMSMLDGYDVSLSIIYHFVNCSLSCLIHVVGNGCFSVAHNFWL